MPSSISSSETDGARSRLNFGSAILLLFAVAAGVCGFSEIAARIGLNHFSRIHRRIMQELMETRNVHQAEAGQPKSMLFVGNSLLLEGVDFSLLTAAISSKYRPTRLVVEQTTYYDWEFALKHLLRQGTQPDYLVLCLSPGHLRSDGVRGDFSSRFLFDARDIWPLSRAVGANLTTTTGFYLAHVSTFYAARTELRSVLIGKLGLSSIQQFWVDMAIVPLKESNLDMTSLYAARLRALADLCRSNGVSLIFLVPPTPQKGDDEVLRAGKLANVPVLRPIPNNSLGTQYYRDEFHLNADGAHLFTLKIADALVAGAQ